MVAVNGNLNGFNLNGIDQNEKAIRQGIDPIGFECSFVGDAYPLRAKRQTRPRFDSEINTNGMSLQDHKDDKHHHDGKRSADFENEINMAGMSLNTPPRDDKPQRGGRAVESSSVDKHRHECITSDSGLCG